VNRKLGRAGARNYGIEDETAASQNDGTPMKRFWTDRIALVAAGIGIVLMILTVVWRVNPVEGSVVPGFLSRNPFGEAVLLVLLVTCMPVWIPTVFGVIKLASFVGVPERDALVFADGAAVIVQGIVCFLFGKLISRWVNKFRAANNRGQ